MISSQHYSSNILKLSYLKDLILVETKKAGGFNLFKTPPPFYSLFTFHKFILLFEILFINLPLSKIALYHTL